MMIIYISIRIISNFLKVIFIFTKALLVSRETQARDLYFIYKNKKNDKFSLNLLQNWVVGPEQKRICSNPE